MSRRELTLPDEVGGRLRLFTVPNGLSLVRVALTVPVLYLLHSTEPGSDRLALIVLVTAGMTDLLDGFVARHAGTVNPAGKVVDPIADKILIGALVIYLTIARGFPWWLLTAVVFRDALLVFLASFLFRRNRVMYGANWSGKLTTFTLGLLILAYVTGWRAGYPVLTAFAVVSLSLSYVSYGRRAWRFVRSGRLHAS